MMLASCLVDEKGGARGFVGVCAAREYAWSLSMCRDITEARWAGLVWCGGLMRCEGDGGV
jgi:hypothetical protein